MNRTIITTVSVALCLMLLIGGAWAAEPDAYPSRYTAAAPKLKATPTVAAAVPETFSRSASLAPAAQATSTAAISATGALAAPFPLPTGAEAVPFSSARGTTAFYTSLSFEEVMTFYRDTLRADGAVEREPLTLTDAEGGTWFSMVFDQWKPGQGLSVVIQGVMLSPGKNVVSLRLERIE